MTRTEWNCGRVTAQRHSTRHWARESTWAESVQVFSGNVFFTADDGTAGRALWKSDGTSAGTVLVKDIDPVVRGSNASLLIVASGTLFLRAADGTVGAELW
jgi:ELWxxDGT repeat protein